MQDAKSKGRLKVWRGENHPCAKLRATDVLKIRKLLIQGHKQRSVAKAYNVSQATITAISVRRNWKSLNG